MSYFILRFNGEGLMPVSERGKQALCAAFEVNEVVRMERSEAVSPESRGHYFAILHEAWLNMREDLLEQYPNPVVLRKRMLIRSGYCTVEHFAAANTAEATKFAAAISRKDEYALVKVTDNVVTRWTAESQSAQAMGKKRFQESKEAVLKAVSELIGTDATTLGRAQAA